MRFSWGATRFVILVGSIAIKLPRLRLIWALMRLMQYGSKGKVRSRLRTYGRNTVHGGVRYILSGWVANWQEYRLWASTRNPLLVPTVFSFFGLINVQKRGEPVSDGKLRTNHPFPQLLRQMSPEGVADMVRPANFCLYESRVRLLDYGSDEVFGLMYRTQVSAVPLGYN